MNSTTVAIVLFDGVCNLCNGAVNFIIDHDRQGRFRFAALQSEAAAKLLAERRMQPFAPGQDTILLVEDGRVYAHSTAALRIARRLRGAWKLAWAFIVVPRPLRDLVYRWVARNRYRWFGKRLECRVPTSELRARFL